MKIFEGKSKEEKYKIIAAIALGALAVLAVGYNLIGFIPRKSSSTVSTSPTPTPGRTTTGDKVVTALPPQEEIDSILSTIPVVYPIVSLGAPDAGRNIFAFYEPPVPTPYSPTPFVATPEIIKTPPPTPEPPLKIFAFSPASVYAGVNEFDLVVSGNAFTPETRIFFNGVEMPTAFLGPDRLSTKIPANLISGAGQKQIFVRTPDGKLYSEPTFFNVEAPPRPQFQYVGIVAPKLGNNATAYLQEGTAQPLPKRLDDRIGVCGGTVPGCFRVVSISREKVVVQDVALGFRYTVEIAKAPGSTSGSSSTTNPRLQPDPRFPTDPAFQPNPMNPSGTPCPPGIPCDQLRPPTRITTDPTKKDVDDKDNDDDGDN